MSKWTTIQQVPLSAWYRMKTDRKVIRRIEEIDLQYAGTPMPDMALKAGPAVKIASVWWRLTELESVFEVSIDAENWTDCRGELLTGDVDKLATSIDKAFEGVRIELEGQRDRANSLTKHVEDMMKQLAELKVKSAPPMGDTAATAPADKPKKS